MSTLGDLLVTAVEADKERGLWLRMEGRHEGPVTISVRRGAHDGEEVGSLPPLNLDWDQALRVLFIMRKTGVNTRESYFQNLGRS